MFFLEIFTVQISDQTLQLFKMLIIINPDCAKFPFRGYFFMAELPILAKMEA